MNLADVMAEVAATAGTVTGLRSVGWQAKRVTPPAAMVELPDGIVYDETYRRGSDSMVLTLLVMVGPVSDRASTKELAAYADGSGVRSIKAAFEVHAWTSCHVAVVESVDFGVTTVAAVELLAARFKIRAVGQGG